MKLDKKNINSILLTFLVHVIIIVLLFIFGFTTKLPKPEEAGGMLVDFGYDETGLGETDPNKAQEIQQPQKIQQVESPQPEVTNTPNPELTQDFDDDAPEILKKPDKKTKTPIKETTEKTVVEQPKVEDPKPVVETKAIYGGKAKGNNNSNSANNGNAGGNGNQGDINGGNTNNFSAGKGGNGISWSLKGSGRTITKQPQLSVDNQENGIVVVDIKVDKYGNVFWAKAGGENTTTTNSRLWKIAEDAAKETKFNEKLDGILETKGSMTFIFKVK